jgi:DNA polymerase elongation subunit (family B)
MLKTNRKRLYFDIETSCNVVLSWNVGRKINIDYSNIIKERAIICICYKWEDDSKVYGLTWDENQDDKLMLEEFVKIANEADELIGHNGDKFDLTWIRTRCVYHQIPMFPKYVTIDTLKIARSQFRFNSNRLDYIAKYLGIGHKIKTDFKLWKDVFLNKDKKALDYMVKYCKMDVSLLEKVHKKLSVHIAAKTHYGVIFGQDRGSCPECGSDDLVIHKRRVTSTGLKKIGYQCKTCYKYHQKTDK